MFEISRVYPTYIYSNTVSIFPLYFPMFLAPYGMYFPLFLAHYGMFFFFLGDFVMFQGVVEFGIGWLGLFPLRSVSGFFKCGYC